MRKLYNFNTMKYDGIQKLSDNLFRIKITLQLRSYGVLNIILDRNYFEITSNQVNVSIEHHGYTAKIVDETFDQLLDPDYALPSYMVNKIGSYVFSVTEDMACIIEYFEWTAAQK